MDPLSLPEQVSAERVVLRRITGAFAEAYFDVRAENAAHLEAHDQWREDLATPEERVAKAAFFDGRWEEGTSFAYAICLLDGAPVGSLAVFNPCWEVPSCELGYWIGLTHQGQGLVSEAVAAVEEQLFGLGFHRIEVRCDPTNPRSSAVARRCGYRQEAHLRESSVLFGRRRDMLVFGKLATD